MNCDSLDEGLLRHWQRLGRFRNRHVAIGGGAHSELEYDDGYMFSRTYDSDGWTDQVLVVLFDE